MAFKRNVVDLQKITTERGGAYQLRDAMADNQRSSGIDIDEKIPAPCLLPAVSVIICFRNESERLARHLPEILEQDYPEFELVAVNDHSTDDSANVVAQLAKRYNNLRLVTPPQLTRPGKKDALTYGIQQARHEILLLTDADCSPISGQWISLMTAPFADIPINLVLGFSPYHQQAGWVNHFQRFETTYTAFQYLGLAKTGRPYMGVGRNIAYRKSFFQRAGGLESHAHLVGGDDDLLVNHHANSRNTAIITDAAAWTTSDPADSWMEYWQRKMRHVSVGVAYQLHTKVLIGLLALSHFAHYFLAILLLWKGSYSIAIAALVALRWLAVIFVYGWCGEERLLDSPSAATEKLAQAPGILFNDFLLNFYYVLTAPALLFSGWRGGWR